MSPLRHRPRREDSVLGKFESIMEPGDSSMAHEWARLVHEWARLAHECHVAEVSQAFLTDAVGQFIRFMPCHSTLRVLVGAVAS